MGIRIELPKPVWDHVVSLADREWRTPKQQAEFLILRALGVEPPFADDAARDEQQSLENTPEQPTGGETKS